MRIPRFVFVSNLAPLYGREGPGLIPHRKGGFAAGAVPRLLFLDEHTRVRNLCLSGVPVADRSTLEGRRIRPRLQIDDLPAVRG
jgi:hypothetical protein